MEQRSKEWFDAKTGVPSCSKFNKIVNVKGDRQGAYMGYLYRLAGERLSGVREETYCSSEMKEGIKREPEARMVYAMENETEVYVPGLLLHPCGKYGGSPDGLVGTDGVIEIKNKLQKNHVKYLDKGRTPGEHFQQMQGYIFVTQREWCDFVSYFPNLPLHQERLHRDEKFIEKLERELDAFCQELDAVCKKILKK